MIGNGPFGGFRVAGRGVAEIRVSADNVRRILKIGDAPQDINIGLLLDHLSVKHSITYDVLEPEEMPYPDVEACWDPESVTMHIRSDVFEKACGNDPRARFTVMHELGHGLLGHRRTINRSGNERTPKVYEDSEWQANQFAAEFLMPLEAIQNLFLNTAFKIEMHFNVSPPAASCRVSNEAVGKARRTSVLKKINDLNAPTLRPFEGGLSIYSLCRCFDRQQRMLSRIFRVSARNLPSNSMCVHLCKCRQSSIKDWNNGTENRSCDLVSSVSLW